MQSINQIKQYISDIILWQKIQENNSLTLSDIPYLIQLRWNYIRDNWSYLRNTVIENAATYSDAETFETQLKLFDKLVLSHSTDFIKINPFTSAINVDKYYSIFENIDISSIELTPEENAIVIKRTDELNRYNRTDFIKRKSAIEEYRDTYTEEHGMGDESYNEIYSRNTRTNIVTPATIKDINFLNNIQAVLKIIDFILVNLYTVDQVVDPFALARTNANNPEVNINTYNSGFLVRLNYNESLSSLARRYLGSPDKWIDIAIANGLKAPYIDEIGEEVYLISNGNGNRINIRSVRNDGSDISTNLYLNQLVRITSNELRYGDQRSIVNIITNPHSDEIVIELSGEDDLSKYTKADSAKIIIYKPFTVNSNQFILIPTEDTVTTDNKEVPWFLKSSSFSEQQAKIDLLLGDDNDLVINNNNDLALSYGINNAVQAIMLKISILRGELSRHPNYGLVNIIGSQTNNTIIRRKLVESITSSIEQDGRFERVKNIDVVVEKDASVQVSLQIHVALKGATQTIPISFEISA